MFDDIFKSVKNFDDWTKYLFNNDLSVDLSSRGYLTSFANVDADDFVKKMVDNGASFSGDDIELIKRSLGAQKQKATDILTSIDDRINLKGVEQSAMNFVDSAVHGNLKFSSVIGPEANFTSTMFGSLTPEQVNHIVTNTANQVYADLGLKDIPTRVNINYGTGMSPGTIVDLGSRSPYGEININYDDILKDVTFTGMGTKEEVAQKLVDDVAHELRHTWQQHYDNTTYVADNINYISPSENFDAYFNQNIEVDARNYAADFSDKYYQQYLDEALEQFPRGAGTPSLSSNTGNSSKGFIGRLKEKVSGLFDRSQRNSAQIGGGTNSGQQGGPQRRKGNQPRQSPNPRRAPQPQQPPVKQQPKQQSKQQRKQNKNQTPTQRQRQQPKPRPTQQSQQGPQKQQRKSSPQQQQPSPPPQQQTKQQQTPPPNQQQQQPYGPPPPPPKNYATVDDSSVIEKMFDGDGYSGNIKNGYVQDITINSETFNIKTNAGDGSIDIFDSTGNLIMDTDLEKQINEKVFDETSKFYRGLTDEEWDTVINNAENFRFNANQASESLLERDAKMLNMNDAINYKQKVLEEEREAIKKTAENTKGKKNKKKLSDQRNQIDIKWNEAERIKQINKHKVDSSFRRTAARDKFNKTLGLDAYEAGSDEFKQALDALKGTDEYNAAMKVFKKDLKDINTIKRAGIKETNRVIDAKIKGLTGKGLTLSNAITIGSAALGAVNKYKESRAEGKGMVSSAARAGATAIAAEVMGPATAVAVMGARALGNAAVEAGDMLYKESRRMNSMSNFTPLGGVNFQDSQELATMRQSGMELAKMSQYNLEQTLMGAEAKHLHR